MKLDYLKKPDRQHPTCQYRNGVGCFPEDFKKKCANCGWNPEVAQARSAQLRTKLNYAMA